MRNDLVFISHSSKSEAARGLVKAISDAVKKAGWRVFFDEEIEVGANWYEQVNRNLAGCSAGVLVLSPEAIASSWVRYEANALVFRKNSLEDEFLLIPVLVSVDPSVLRDDKDLAPLKLHDIQALKANAGSPAEIANQVAARLGEPKREPRKADEKRTNDLPASASALRDMREATLPPKERARAGLTLDKLGDVRFENNPWKLPDDEMLGFVRIPAGPFLMGSTDADKQADDDEKPQHKVTLPEYYMGRYPVTVGQFRAYCEAAKVTWEDPEALEGASNLPVAYVSWDEAVEYCMWLTKELEESKKTPEALRRLLQVEGGEKWHVTLPSEAEWEKGARGTDGRKWPWGNEWDAGRANCSETGVGERTPVGCFYEGRSPCGLEETSGNVWEWTRSVGGEYPYPEDRKGKKIRESLKGDGFRVVRGGSCFGAPGGVRCAVRVRDPPDFRSGGLGFRLALSPFL